MAAPVVVNGAFWPQQVTGQQRYAREVVGHLDTDAVPLITPPDAWSGSAARTWAWTQTGLPRAARGSVLLSLTSRAPVAHRRHVITVHDLFVLHHPEWYSRRYLSVHRPLLRRLLRTAAGIVVVSDPVRDQVRATGLVPDAVPVVVAPNASGAALALEDPDAVHLPFLGQQQDRPFLLAVGSLEPRKNLARLVQAHRLLPEEVRRACPLVLTGASASIFAAADVPVDEHVLMAGFVSDEVLAASYRRARAVAMVSLDEGFGLPVIEALDSGARVVASDIPVFRWVAGEAPRYVDPLDPAAIAEGLAEVIATPDAPRAAPPRHFDYADSARTILDLAQSLA